jgi:hypothetical protein
MDREGEARELAGARDELPHRRRVIAPQRLVTDKYGDSEYSRRNWQSARSA